MNLITYYVTISAVSLMLLVTSMVATTHTAEAETLLPIMMTAQFGDDGDGTGDVCTDSDEDGECDTGDEPKE